MGQKWDGRSIEDCCMYCIAVLLYLRDNVFHLLLRLDGHMSELN